MQDRTQDSRKRVILVSPSSKLGGAERALTGLSRHLPEHGWSPIAALLEAGPLADWLEAAGCPSVLLPEHRTRQLFRSMGTIKHLASLTQSSGAAVVLSNMDKGHIFGGSAAFLVKRPAILWDHGVTKSRFGMPTNYLAIAAATIPKAVILASSDLAVAAQRRFARAPVRKVAPGIAVDEVASASGQGFELRRSLGWTKHTIVGIVGRLQPWKGQKVFLRSASILAREDSDLRFCIIGGAILGWEGSYEQDLKSLVDNDPILRGRVHFTGHKDPVYPWMDALDIVVHASFGEPFGLVVVEAMALSKPLVATAVGGPTEIVEDGVSGLLVSPGDVGALTAAIRRLLTDPALAVRLAAGARRRAAVFSEQAMTTSIAGILDDLVVSR